MEDAELWQAYAWPQTSLRVNFVVSMDGHIGGADGRSAALSSPEDRRLFHMLRAGCDAILVGAGTARAENYRPVALKPQWSSLRGHDRIPALVFVSRTGDVPDLPGAEVIDGSELPELKQRYPRILCEGGAQLFSVLLAQGLVDEIALSISGHIGGTGRLLADPVISHATAKHAHIADDTVFTLWDVS